MRVSCRRSAVLFDALLNHAVRHREHLIHKVGKALVFDVAALGILGGRFRVARHGNNESTYSDTDWSLRRCVHQLQL